MALRFIKKWISNIVATQIEQEQKKGNRFTGIDSDTYNKLSSEKYLYDFKARFTFPTNGTTAIVGGAFTTPDVSIIDGNPSTDDGTDIENNVQDKQLQPAQKIAIKPIDALNELETVPTPFNCEMLDEKIEVMELKRKFIQNNYSRNDVDGLIERFQARKKYHEHFEFYSRFQNTTDEKIEKLLSKYELVMKPSDLFIPEFPTEAIRIMAEYEEKSLMITGKKSVYYVIADEDKFRKAYERRDPILLVQSPFGFFWQILGAWDKEMLILGEL